MMMRGLKLGISKEEKVAMAIGKQLSDYSLDLEAVGKYLAVAQPYLIYRRALEVLEAAGYNKEVVEYNRLGYYSDKIL
jgi:hypothetical protein